MTQYSIWEAFSGREAILLMVALLGAAAIMVGLGAVVKRPIGARHGGVASGAFVVLIWGLSIVIMQCATYAYGIAIYNETVAQGQKVVAVPNPITKFTLLFALIAFFVVFVWTRRPYGWKLALVSGVAGAGAGPVMFEFGFDWIIMWRLAVPDPVGLYRWLYFCPLFLFILATLALLTLTPAARLRRETLFSLAAMFVIWAGWALFAGFSHPTLGAAPLVFNVTSKLAAAIAGLMIFLPVRDSIADAPANPSSLTVEKFGQKRPFRPSLAKFLDSRRQR